MITDDLENKEKAEKIHHLFLEIDKQKKQAQQHFKYRTLPFLIVIVILLFTAFYLIYPYLYDLIETLMKLIEEQPPFYQDQENPNLLVYEIVQQGILIKLIPITTKSLYLNLLS